MTAKKEKMTPAERRKRRKEINAAYFARLTPEEREARKAKERERRKQKRRERPRFTCARCGQEFFIPDSPISKCDARRTRSFVKLGGVAVCEVCARERFRRKYNVWGMNPDAIPTGAF